MKARIKQWRLASGMIACIVVISTMYAFLLPAITLGKTAECGIEEHQHDDSCFEEQLICGQEEDGEHQHTDACCRNVLVCGKEVHSHSRDCFQNQTGEETAQDCCFGKRKGCFGEPIIRISRSVCLMQRE